MNANARTSVIALATITALSCLSAPASADIWRANDAVGDVNAADLGYLFEHPGSTWPAAPDQVQGDITAIRVNHLPRKVLVSLTFRKLTLNGGPAPYEFIYRLRTGDAIRDAYLYLGGTRRFDGPRSQMVARTGDGPKSIDCRLAYRTFPDVRTVVLEVPRSCFGANWRWVRVGANARGNAKTSTDPGPGPDYFWYDIALRGAFRPEEPSNAAWVLSPRIY